MELALTRAEISLQNNHPISLRRAQGVRIVCTHGTIWITVAGKAEDIFLMPGQSHCLENNRLTLIESIGQGRIRLDAPSWAGIFQLALQIPTALWQACRRTVGAPGLFNLNRYAATGLPASLAK